MRLESKRLPGPESSYRKQDEHVLIELELNNLRQMFNTLDPSPFYEKDIDADAEEYIIGAAREIPLKEKLKLVIYLPAIEARKEDPKAVAAAIHHYFSYKLSAARRQLRLIFREGRASLAIGLTFLLICVTAQTALVSWKLEEDFMLKVITEGLIICGWVSMWRPIQIFLYEWWPVILDIRVFKKLSSIPVEIRID